MPERGPKPQMRKEAVKKGKATSSENTVFPADESEKKRRRPTAKQLEKARNANQEELLVLGENIDIKKVIAEWPQELVRNRTVPRYIGNLFNELLHFSRIQGRIEALELALGERTEIEEKVKAPKKPERR